VGELGLQAFNLAQVRSPLALLLIFGGLLGTLKNDEPLEPLLRSLALALPPGGTLLMQSDVLAVIEPMLAQVEASGCFERPSSDPFPWLETNPLAVPTERERLVLAQGLPVYRVRYCRHHGAVPVVVDPQDTHNPCVTTRA
jgi:hypothetical protein